MSDLDEAAIKKLKVAELRAELQNRGLDSKGNKPVLVERLLEAISNVEPTNGDQPMEHTSEEPQEGATETAEETPGQEKQPDDEADEAEAQEVEQVTQDNVTVSSEPAPALAAEAVPSVIEEKPLEKVEETAPEPTPQDEEPTEKHEDESKTEEAMDTSQEIASSTTQASEGWCCRICMIEFLKLIWLLFGFGWMW